jgi:hypothetical protein
MSLLKADAIDFTKVGGDPSSLRSNYLFAYLSLAGMSKLGNGGRDAGVTDVSNAKVMEVLRVRNILVNADRKGRTTAAAWTSYRAGKYNEAADLLPPVAQQ